MGDLSLCNFSNAFMSHFHFASIFSGEALAYDAENSVACDVDFLVACDADLPVLCTSTHFDCCSQELVSVRSSTLHALDLD